MCDRMATTIDNRNSHHQRFLQIAFGELEPLIPNVSEHAENYFFFTFNVSTLTIMIPFSNKNQEACLERTKNISADLFTVV